MAGRTSACWLPMIHPRISPKAAPAMPKITPSRDMYRLSYYRVQVILDGLRQADPQRVTDERVADRHLGQVRQRPEEHQVLQIEIVSGIDAQTEFVREPRRRHVARERLPAGRLARFEGPREGLGIQLDPIRAEPRGPAHRFRLRLDEDADANPGLLEPRDDAPELVNLSDGRVRRPSGVTRDFARCGRHERALSRLHLQHEVDQRRPRIALDVE